jgi:hypothetical protein
MYATLHANARSTMRHTALLVIGLVALVDFSGCKDERGSGPVKTDNDGKEDKQIASSDDAAPKLAKQKEKEKTKISGKMKINTKGDKRGTYAMLGERTVNGTPFRSVAPFGPGIYYSGEEIKLAWPVVAAEYAKLKIGMRVQEEVGPILGFDEFWYVPHTPSERFVLTLDDMESKSMTLTFAGDWPNMKLVDKKSRGLK